MKRRAHLKEHLVTALEIPRDLAYQEIIYTVTGKHDMVIENYRSILRYTREEIVITSSCGTLTICGCNLEIPFYTLDEMQVSGCISCISMN